MSGVAIKAQHRAGKTGLQQRNRKLAATTADIHNVAERFVRRQRQHVLVHRVATQFARHVTAREPAAIAIASRHAFECGCEVRARFASVCRHGAAR